MNWKRFNLINNVLGWLVFVIATTVYLMTIGPTASLWDCAEFIACDYRLEVGHPPGAPFYMLVYNVISHLAPDATQVALYTNATSAVISGLTILFLFWTITHMLRRVINPHFRLSASPNDPSAQSISLSQGIAIFGSALVGSLVYTFSDTFWYSAVEAEVYAFSSLFTAVVFWLMFKWEERSDAERSDRWIILIAYLMGLSIGVHLLNLLCLPAMALIYYYHKADRPSIKGMIASVLVSFVLIVVMMYGIVQGVPKMAGRFDYFFVNTLGTSFNTGLYFYLALVLAILSWSVYEAHRVYTSGSSVDIRLKAAIFASILIMGIPFLGGGMLLGIVLSIALGVYLFKFSKLQPRLVHTMQMSLLAIAIGFSSYGVILVRAIADTPMNENAPNNAFSLRYYLAREQYGAAPLLYGPSFASRAVRINPGKEVIGKAPKASPNDPDRYVKLYDQPEAEYPDDQKMFFPRVHDRSRAQSYNIWMGRNPNDMSQPTFGDNLRYFFTYQVNYMYWRYFLWNFAGRQNDLPGDGGLMKGNAVTGISFIDNFLVGSQDNMPDSMAKNKGYNVYYAMPLVLGLLGMFYQVSRRRLRKRGDKTLGTEDEYDNIGHYSFWITFLLFFMTGLAILLYLNQTPGQPRERDYAYAGSFYAFAIWIGFGVAGLWRLIARAKLSDTASAITATAIALIVPIQMASQNWDDHDRSGRTIARDMGINYLESCEPNALLVCYGDNDTFPLWYAQDVEGVRTDVRTMNLSYLGGDWYIDQMRRATYEGKPVPMKYMKPDFYYFKELAYVADEKRPMLLEDALKLTTGTPKETEAIFPTQFVMLPVDSATVAQSLERENPELAKRVVPNMPISLAGKQYLDRGGLVLLDMLQENEWKRPIYWCITSPRNAFSNMPNYHVQTGMTYQLLPLDLTTDSIRGEVEPLRLEQMYTNVMTKFRWGGADNPNVYLDDTGRNMMVGMRSNVFVPLAKALLKKGDKARAQEVLRRCLEVIRPEVVPYDYFSIRFAQALYEAGMHTEADQVASEICSSAMRTLDWCFRLSESNLKRAYNDGEMHNNFDTALMTYQIARSHGSTVLDMHQEKLLLYSRYLAPERAAGEPTKEQPTSQPAQ